MPEAQPLEHSSQTREKILSTAARMFSNQGYDNTSLSQVAKEASVSKALIFWHFDSKEKLFQAALNRTLEPYFINIGDIEGLDEPAQIERLIDLFFDFVQENVYSVRFLLSLVLRGPKQPDETVDRVSELYRVFRSLLADIIDSGRRSGRFRADANPTLDAQLILATLDGILVEHLRHDKNAYDSAELLGHLKRTFVQRLVA